MVDDQLSQPAIVTSLSLDSLRSVLSLGPHLHSLDYNAIEFALNCVGAKNLRLRLTGPL